eukprot:gene4129-4529_t
MISILTVISSFLATNLDNLAIVITLFAQADLNENRRTSPSLPPSSPSLSPIRSSSLPYQADESPLVLLPIHIVLGQYLGFTIICVISLIIAWIGSELFPDGYIELLGIFPFFLGCWEVSQLVMSCCTNKREEVSGGASSSVPIYQSIPDEESLHSISTTPFKGGGPAISLSGSECHEGSSSTTTTCRDVLTRACSPIFSFFFHHNVIEVAGLSLACGGDNVVIYSALFSTLSSTIDYFLVLMIFYSLIFLLLLFAYHFIHCRYVDQWLKDYGDCVVPFVWIAVGTYILSQSILYQSLLCHYHR